MLEISIRKETDWVYFTTPSFEGLQRGMSIKTATRAELRLHSTSGKVGQCKLMITLCMADIQLMGKAKRYCVYIHR